MREPALPWLEMTGWAFGASHCALSFSVIMIGWNRNIYAPLLNLYRQQISALVMQKFAIFLKLQDIHTVDTGTVSVG